MLSPLSEPYETAIRALSQALKELNTSGVLIGGVAVSLIAEPRYTKDIDAVIMWDTEDIERLMASLIRNGFESLVVNILGFAKVYRVLPLRHLASAIPIDLSLGSLPFESEMIDRASPTSFAGAAIGIPTPEDLIILKGIANRPKDREDILRIAQVYPGIDKARIRMWLMSYGDLLDTPGLWSEIETLLTSKNL